MSAVPEGAALAKAQGIAREALQKVARIPPNKGTGNSNDPPTFKPSPISAEALLRKEFPPIKWTIQDILPEGVFLLTARPKIGKSWLALQTCIGVASGKDVLNRATAKGSALYLALEDNERRLQQRLFKYRAGFLSDQTALQRVEFVTDWRRSDEGGLEDISAWLNTHPDARLVVIDTLERFRPRRNERANAYGEDYAALHAIKTLADTRQITVLVIHHNRKAESADPLDAISGTLGISGAADGALVLTRARGSEQAELHLIGRDIAEEGAYAVVFERKSCMWTMQGAASEVAKTREQQAIFDLLRIEKRPMSPKEIAEELGRNRNTVRRLLQGLLKDDKLLKDSKTGAYSLP